jgi:hypothetical protein
MINIQDVPQEIAQLKTLSRMVTQSLYLILESRRDLKIIAFIGTL